MPAAAAIPAAARGLDAQPLAGVEAADRLGRQLLAVEQVAAGRSVTAPVRARRQMTPAFGDQLVAEGREGLEFADHAVAAMEFARAARVAAQAVLDHP